jgi:hypothetical protein
MTESDLQKKKDELHANQEFYNSVGDKVGFKIKKTGDTTITSTITESNFDSSFRINLDEVSDEEVKKYLRDCKKVGGFGLGLFAKKPDNCDEKDIDPATDKNNSRIITPNEMTELVSYTPAPPNTPKSAASSGGKRKSKRKHRKSRKSKKSRRKPRKSKKSKKSKKSRKH